MPLLDISAASSVKIILCTPFQLQKQADLDSLSDCKQAFISTIFLIFIRILYLCYDLQIISSSYDVCMCSSDSRLRCRPLQRFVSVISQEPLI